MADGSVWGAVHVRFLLTMLVLSCVSLLLLNLLHTTVDFSRYPPHAVIKAVPHGYCVASFLCVVVCGLLLSVYEQHARSPPAGPTARWQAVGSCPTLPDAARRLPLTILALDLHPSACTWTREDSPDTNLGSNLPKLGRYPHGLLPDTAVSVPIFRGGFRMARRNTCLWGPSFRMGGPKVSPELPPSRARVFRIGAPMTFGENQTEVRLLRTNR